MLYVHANAATGAAAMAIQKVEKRVGRALMEERAGDAKEEAREDRKV